jgi:hypothetical protein
LEPGQPNALYHAESEQEAFLVLSWECRLLVEGEERLLRNLAWLESVVGRPAEATLHLPEAVDRSERLREFVSRVRRGGLRRRPDPRRTCLRG